MAEQLVVTIDGAEHGLSLDTVTATEWRDIHRYTGLTPIRFVAAMASPADCPPDAIEALRWLFLARSGGPVPLGGEESGGFALFEFLEGLRRVEDPEEKSAPKAGGKKRG